MLNAHVRSKIFVKNHFGDTFNFLHRQHDSGPERVMDVMTFSHDVLY